MLIGTLFALAAGLMWGLVFVGPLLLPDYPAAFLSFGRYVAFGLIALPLAWMDRRRLAELERSDWLEAARLGLVGNVLYYLFLASAIQRAGGPLPTMIIGTLPVVIAVCSNKRDARRDGRLPWSRLVPSLLLIAVGMARVIDDDGHPHGPAPLQHHQADRVPLGADGEAIARVLDVAARDDGAVVTLDGRAHLKVRVRRVRAPPRLPGLPPQLRPRALRHRPTSIPHRPDPSRFRPRVTTAQRPRLPLFH